MIWLTNFPLPPTVNKYLMAVGSRMVKTKVHREYLDACQLWALQNRRVFVPMRDLMQAWKQEMEVDYGHCAFRVDCHFVFNKNDLFTLTGKLQTLDANNRLKPALDGLSAIIGIDDSAFFAGNCEKVYTTTKGRECSMIRIEPMRPRTMEEVHNQALTETTPDSSS